jgi:ketosteroid isomerase-like protein
VTSPVVLALKEEKMSTAITTPTVADALECMNEGDCEGLCSLFAEDGVVVHGDGRHEGRGAIADWFAKIPSVLIRPIRTVRQGAHHVIDAEVEGVSPDGPQLHRFTFELAEHQIRSMSVNVLR